MKKQLLDRYLQYPWHPSFLEFYIVAMFVSRTPIELVKGVQSASIDLMLASIYYSNALGFLILTVLTLCFYTLNEPRREWAGWLSALIVSALFMTLFNVNLGIIIALVAIILQEVNSTKQPEIDIDEIGAATLLESDYSQFKFIIYRAAYPRLSNFTFGLKILSIILVFMVSVLGSESVHVSPYLAILGVLMITLGTAIQRRFTEKSLKSINNKDAKFIDRLVDKADRLLPILKRLSTVINDDVQSEETQE